MRPAPDPPSAWRRFVLGLPPAPWAIAGAAILALLAIPIVVIAVGVLEPAGETWRHLAETVLADYLRNSAILAVGSGSLALVIGVSTAWLVTACEFPGRRVFEWALILPLAVPAYVAAYTYAGMLDVTGPLHPLIVGLFGGLFPGGYVNIMRIETVLVIFALVFYPYVYLIARASFVRQSRTILDAARTMGRGPWAGFFGLALPMARPALVAGVSLVIMEVLNDYGAVKYFGVPTFTTGIFRSWFALGDLDAAVRLSGFLMLFVFLLLALERIQRGEARYDDGTATHRPLSRYRLRGWGAAAAFAACLLPLALGFLLPVAQLGLWSARTAARVVNAGFVGMVANSFALAAAAALLCVVAGLVLAYAARLARASFPRLLSRISVLGYSIPGAVIAVGVLIPFGWFDRTVDDAARSLFGVSTGLLVTGTLAALVFAYVVRFMAVAFMPIESGFERVGRNVEAASRSLGAAPLRTLLGVGLPVLRGTLLGALILVFVDVLKELPLTLILRPFNFDTLATSAFQLATDEMVAESASAALIIIATSLIPVVLLNRVFTRRGG